MHVLVFGHSFIRRLDDALNSGSSPGYGLEMGFVADVYPIWVYFYVFVILPGLLSMQ